jgi:hypothetical protein
MSVPLAQFFVTTAQSQAQLVLQSVKVSQFPLYVGKLFLKSALDGCARLQTIPSQPQKPANLAELESQTLDAAHESQRSYVILAVSSEAAFGSRRSWEQAVALVETDRVDGKAYPFRDNANLHDLGSSPNATPWTIVQSQGRLTPSFLLARNRSL